MMCPKCKETALKKIIFKKSRKRAYLCTLCGALWLEGEHINEYSGHTIHLYAHEEDREYTFDEEDTEGTRLRKEENLDL